MDIQIMIIGCAVFVVSALLIYLVSVFSMREKTYDEVIEEQRRRQEDEKLKLKNEKKTDKKKSKWKKGKGDKDKTEDKSSQATEVEAETHKFEKMVEYELEPEIIQPVAEQKSESKKTGKPKKTKPILLNKEEKSVKTSEEAFVAHVPKDSIELKHEHDVKTKPEKSNKKTKLEEPAIVQVEEVSVSASVNASPPTEGKKNKKAKDQDVSESAATLMSTVKAASLSDPEIQKLVEALLIKQSGAKAASAEWTKKSQKGDPVAALRKQLEDTENVLQEEQRLASGASNKLKELRQDLSGEKQRYAALEKSSEDKISRLSQEIQALHVRMQTSHEQHFDETNRMKMQIKQMEGQVKEDQSAIIHRLTEENKKLKEDANRNNRSGAAPGVDVTGLQQQLKIIQDELSRNAIKFNSQEKNMEKTVHSYEEKIKKLESSKHDSESVLSRKLNEVNEELRRAQAMNASLQRDLIQANSVARSAEDEMKSFKNKIQAHESSQETIKTLDYKLKNVESKFKELEKKNQEKDKELMEIREENSNLVQQLKTTKERSAGEGQEAPAPPQVPGSVSQSATEHGTDKTMIQIEEHEQILGQKLKETDGLREEIENLTKEVESQRQKNNELREKNWKAMEALANAEKKASDNKTAVAKDDSALVAKGILQRLFPKVAVNETLADTEWMSVFEKDASQYLTQISTQQSPEMESKLVDALSAQNKLQSQVAHYKTVLAETETILNKLQSSVESEEKKWQEKLTSSESDLSTARQELKKIHDEFRKATGSTEMEEKIKHLETKIEITEKERDSLQNEFDKTTNLLSTVKDELENVKQSQNGLDDSGNLKSDLEAERKGKKELASANVKLSGMLKTGQDALKQEQELVNKLQSQLEQKTNGVASSPEKELLELKNKLAESQKQLEKEMMSNRQLSQRLASMAASVTGNEGTTV